MLDILGNLRMFGRLWGLEKLENREKSEKLEVSERREKIWRIENRERRENIEKLDYCDLT